jgi:hypothetical protein
MGVGCSPNVIRRSTPTAALKIKELANTWAQDSRLPIKKDSEGVFGCKKPRPRPDTWRKIHHWWGISLSAQPVTSRHIVDGHATSACGLVARSLQSLSQCPLSQQRGGSRVGLASGMLWNKPGESMYSKMPCAKGQNHAGPYF